MSEWLYILVSVFVAFGLGIFTMIIIGNKLSFNYLKVKMSKGRKVLIFLKTNFGWVSEIATKKENYILWKKDKIEYITSVNSKNVFRFGAIECVFINSETSELTSNPTNEPIKIDATDFYPDNFDIVVYRNLLSRALTQPSEQEELIKKILMIILVLVIIIALGIVLVYTNQMDLAKQVQAISRGMVL